MPRGTLTKIDLESRIYKLKTSLYNGNSKEKNSDWHDGAHHVLNKVLDILGEYRQ